MSTTDTQRRRPDGTFEPVDWATAIAEIAARYGEIIEHHGGDKILFAVMCEPST